MTEPAERVRPYASPSNVLSVFHRVRSRNLPDKIDNDFLRIAGIGEAVFGRVTATLRFLDMIDEGLRPTDTLRALSAAPDEDYRIILAGAIRAAYAEDFARIDPEQDTQARIVDAFRPYQPRSQTSRMVMLFLGLCREAGIPVLDAPRERPMRGTTAPRAAAKAAPRKAAPARHHASGNERQHPPAPQAGLLFGVTEDDIGALPEDEFQEVWAALGKVARARAKQRQASAPDPQEADDEEA